jgi:23S rRNA (guanine2445-N2)-methyltransferase / 23S rRNA (guanine2069-N7)-methyltransferase
VRRRKYQLFNGAIECTLIVADPIAPPQRDRSAEPQALSEGAQMVANRLRKNLRKLKSWREREGVYCYRAYDADIPEYAAAIDIYETVDAVPRTFLHVQEYAAPAEIPLDVQRRRLNETLAAAREVLGVPREQTALKTRTRGKGGSKYGQFDTRGEFVVVREGDALLRVNLFDYLDTGLFLDHRPMRLRIADEASDARFLNLFAYTGAATVQPRMGARARPPPSTVRHLPAVVRGQSARERHVAAKHRLVQADAMRMAGARRGRIRPDLLRPAHLLQFQARRRLRRAGRARGTAARRRRAPVARGCAVLLQQLPPLQPGRSCGWRSSRMRRDQPRTIPPDFERDARIHRCWQLRGLKLP